MGEASVNYFFLVLALLIFLCGQVTTGETCEFTSSRFLHNLCSLQIAPIAVLPQTSVGAWGTV